MVFVTYLKDFVVCSEILQLMNLKLNGIFLNKMLLKF